MSINFELSNRPDQPNPMGQTIYMGQTAPIQLLLGYTLTSLARSHVS
jgi:hypothetical protein